MTFFTKLMRIRWRAFVHHARDGLHSGIPWCCVLFFSSGWLFAGRGRFGNSNEAWRVMKRRGIEWDNRDEPHYVRCWLCWRLDRRREILDNGHYWGDC